MIWILFILLFAMSLFAYYLGSKDIMSPSFILITLFMLTTIVAIVGNMKWKVDVSPDVVIAVVIGLSCIQCGELFARSAKKRQGIYLSERRTGESFASREHVNIKTSKLVFLIVIDAVVLMLYFRRLVNMASSIGYTGSMLLQFVRVATINNDISVGAFFTITLGVIEASNYVCLYTLISNHFNKEKSLSKAKKLLMLIPTVISLTVNALSGARNGFILFSVMLISIFLFCNSRKRGQVKLIKVLPVICFCLFTFMIVFTELGKLTGKTGENAIDKIVLYTGSSIIGLSEWLKDYVPSSMFGQESFWGVRYLLHMLFPEIESASHYLAGVYFTGGIGTNIFTAFRSFIADFGWIGLIVICAVIGYIYTYAYLRVCKRPRPVTIILYSYFLYNYIYMIFTPSVTSNLFTSSQIFGVFWIIVVTRFALGGKRGICNE